MKKNITNRNFELNKNNKRNTLVDLLKFVCIILVIMQHTTAFPNNIYDNYWVRFAVPTFLMLSGYTWFISYQKSEINKITDAYKPKFFFGKFLRLFIPWAIYFIVTLCVLVGLNQKWNNWYFRDIFRCGFGYGEYFINIMFQLLIFYPLIFFVIKKWNFKGFVGIFIFEICFELFCWGALVDSQSWIFMSFKYFGFVGFGAFLANDRAVKFSFKNWKIDIVLVVCFLIGFGLLYMLFNTDVTKEWTFFWHMNYTYAHGTFIGCLYWLPLMYVLFKKVNIKSKWPVYLGNFTFEIYLVQMSYFSIISQLNMYQFASNNYWLQLLVNLSICFAIGYIYYLLVEKLILSNLLKKFKNNKTKNNIKKIN